MARLTSLSRLVAFSIVTIAFACTARASSLVVDGTRYFWLDDDQMISMRYAWNLAHGHGLVWNLGERVEGYTNPGWTLVMAGLHLLPIPDAKMALAVAGVSWLLACAILVLAERLTRQLVPGDDVAAAFVIVTLAACHDLLFWAVNGFDATLMTAIFLFVVVRLIDEGASSSSRAVTCLALALLPIVRSDGLYVWAGAAAVAFAVSRDRRGVLAWLAASLVLMAAHLAFRHAYYGEWLPNTFYVKVSGITGRIASGAGYFKGFVAHYAVLLPLAAAAVFMRGSRVAQALAVPILIGAAYVLYAGADMWPFTRFMAFAVPVLLALAAAGITILCKESVAARAVVYAAVAASVLFQVGVNGPSQFFALASGNGEPSKNLVAALAVLKNTDESASIAVVAAGVAPYFTHRPAMDVMGLSDHYIARLPAHADEPTGHTKYDIAYSLARRPDVLMPLWNENHAHQGDQLTSRTRAIATDPTFERDYADQPIRIDSPDGPVWLYVNRTSTAARSVATWRGADVAR